MNIEKHSACMVCFLSPRRFLKRTSNMEYSTDQLIDVSFFKITYYLEDKMGSKSACGGWAQAEVLCGFENPPRLSTVGDNSI